MVGYGASRLTHVLEMLARIQRASVSRAADPDFAALNPGYGLSH
jgi:hypothetical protein